MSQSVFLFPKEIQIPTWELKFLFTQQICIKHFLYFAWIRMYAGLLKPPPPNGFQVQNFNLQIEFLSTLPPHVHLTFWKVNLGKYHFNKLYWEPRSCELGYTLNQKMSGEHFVLGDGFGFEAGSHVLRLAPTHNVARTSKHLTSSATSPSLAMRFYWLKLKKKKRKTERK